ncbi:uncharacterized protein F5Z01DRAFT_665727 [Emericellopsis atlantica]|uniref:RING-type domain-containing protein n=1 Tax=Emericellopsis atlantica TaxID=2614577 RepID=A0A9P8CKL0_9HYPO|nr:uncharacterized protein F5Z01DRAFT_665727 [Emericellopsis atlantica]KAG9250679.1 hypothetical protein F5Z01DRAFT_665727 [Emericellopsis atlantica]
MSSGMSSTVPAYHDTRRHRSCYITIIDLTTDLKNCMTCPRPLTFGCKRAKNGELLCAYCAEGRPNLAKQYQWSVCSICYEDVELMSTCCGHAFCLPCWFNSMIEGGLICPLCRVKMGSEPIFLQTRKLGTETIVLD